METFGFDLADTARLMRRAFDRRAAELGITRAQWRVLSLLSRRGGARQIELADTLDLEPITLGRQLDRLAEAGLVERRPDERDRRAWNIHLTEAAGPLIERLHALGDRFHEDALAGISPAEKAAVGDVLARVRDNLIHLNSASRDEPARRIS